MDRIEQIIISPVTSNEASFEDGLAALEAIPILPYVDWLKDLELTLEMAQVAYAERAHVRTEMSMESKWTKAIETLWMRFKFKASYQKPKWQSVHNKLKTVIDEVRRRFDGPTRKNLIDLDPPTELENLLMDMADDIDRREINPGCPPLSILTTLGRKPRSSAGHSDFEMDATSDTQAISSPYSPAAVGYAADTNSMTTPGSYVENDAIFEGIPILPYVDWLKELDLLQEMAQVAVAEKAYLRTDLSMEVKWTQVINVLWQRPHFAVGYQKPKWQSVHNKLRTAIEMTRKKFNITGPDRKIMAALEPTELETLLLDMADENEKRELSHAHQTRRPRIPAGGSGPATGMVNYDIQDHHMGGPGGSFIAIQGGMPPQTAAYLAAHMSPHGHGGDTGDDGGYNPYASHEYADLSGDRGPGPEQSLAMVGPGGLSAMGLDHGSMMNALKTDDRFVELLLEERRAELKRKNDEHEEEMSAKKAKRLAEEEAVRSNLAMTKLKQEAEFNLQVAQAKAAEAAAAAQQAQAEAQKAQTTMTWEIVNMIKDLRKS